MAIFLTIPMSQDHSSYNRWLIKRLDDLISRYEKTSYAISDFLGPSELKLAQEYLQNKVSFEVIPSDDNSISRCICLPAYQGQLVTLRAKVSPKVTQRNVYGALLASGIAKNRLGDVWVTDGYAYLITKNELTDFISKQVILPYGSDSFEILKDLVVPDYKYSKKLVFVNSLRIDALVSEIVGCSRAKAQQLIAQGMINRNFLTIEKCDELCDNGDIISIRQVGRFKLVLTTSVTKSGNKAVEVFKFI